MVDDFDIERKWWNHPPNAAFEGVAFPCTPTGFDYFQSTHLINKHGQELEMRPDLGLTTWGELFPSSILLRFMRGLVGERGKLPEVEAQSTSEWHFILRAMMMESDWLQKTSIRKQIKQWVFGEMFEEAISSQKEGMNLILDVFYAVAGGYAGVEVAIEMGILNHDMLFEPINEYEFTRDTVEEGLKMLNEKQAFAWTNDGMMV